MKASTPINVLKVLGWLSLILGVLGAILSLYLTLQAQQWWSEAPSWAGGVYAASSLLMLVLGVLGWAVLHVLAIIAEGILDGLDLLEAQAEQRRRSAQKRVRTGPPETIDELLSERGL